MISILYKFPSFNIRGVLSDCEERKLIFTLFEAKNYSMPLGYRHIWCPMSFLSHVMIQDKVCGPYYKVIEKGPGAPRDDAPGTLNNYSFEAL